jgi:hypothetical protein
VAGSRRPVVESAATSINLIANGGADDARLVDDANLLGLIASAILERPTCLDCLDAKVEAPTLSVVRTVDRIGKTISVHASNERCGACGSTVGPIYSLRRPQ